MSHHSVFRSRFLLLLLSLGAAPLALAGDDPWADAFPENCGESCQTGQGIAITGEAIVGVGALTAVMDAKPQMAQRLRTNGLNPDPEGMLKNSARRAAIEELTAKDPAAVRLLDEKMKLENLKESFHNAKHDPEALRAFYQKIPQNEFEERLAAFEMKRAAVKGVEKSLAARTDELLSAAKAGKTIPASMKMASQYYRDFKPKINLPLVVGVALVADGGLRLGAALQDRNPGYLPAVSAGVTVVKHLVTRPAEEKAGAETSMDVK